MTNLDINVVLDHKRIQEIREYARSHGWSFDRACEEILTDHTLVLALPPQIKMTKDA